MNNFIQAVHSIWVYAAYSLRILIHHPATMGFGLGFLASSVVHLLVIADHPRRIPAIISKSLEVSYAHLNPQDESHTDYKTLDHFRHEYHRVRIVFFATISIAVIMLLVGLVQTVLL